MMLIDNGELGMRDKINIDDCYKGFARMYDRFMLDAPYTVWVDYIDRVLKSVLRGKDSPIVLDLACGTGSITIPLSKMGYDMIGVDQSADMLLCAQDKAMEQGLSILFLMQDMRELDLYGTVDAAVCVCDGMNYILEEEELGEVFRRVSLFTSPGGVFIFDMNTDHKFRELGSASFTETAEGFSYQWDNSYDDVSMINRYDVTFLDLESREVFSETHFQRAYPAEVVKRLLVEAGFERVEMFKGYSDEPFTSDTSRIVCIGYK